jgi:hypothetical protein
MAQHMITTIDNPFNPLTHFDAWYAEDVALGHHTSAFLARVVRTSDELSEADQEAAIEDAIDEIVKENVSGLYRKVSSTTA